jgi:hypothetical protein
MIPTATIGERVANWTGFHLPTDLAFGREAIDVAGADGPSIWTPDRQKLARFGPDEPHPMASD